MLVSLEKKFIFIHIPKTAGTSLRELLEPYCVQPERSQLRRLFSHLPVPEAPEKAWLRLHDTAWWAKLKLPRDVFRNSLKFAVVRNPYDYAVSYFEYQRTFQSSSRYEKAAGEDFAGFLRRMARKNRLKGIRQSNWVCDLRGRVIVDELLHMERLDAELPKLLDLLGIPFDGKLARKNVTKRSPLATYYSDEAKELALALFARDFDLFGYDRALPGPAS